MRSGLHGYVVELATKSGRDFIVMHDPNFKLPFPMPRGQPSISDNGQHFGVVVKDYVFDNIFREGTPLAGWQAHFDCAAHSFTQSIIEPF